MEKRKAKKVSVWKCIVVGFFVFSILTIILVANHSKSERLSRGQEAPTRYSWGTWDEQGEMPNANVVIVVDRAYSQGTYIRTGAITGRALNNTPDQFSYAQITFGIYQNDAKYGSCLANTSYLDSGATWKFEASCVNVPDGTWQYKVEDVTYW